MNDKQKTLEDLVPPLELCKAACEAGVIGDDTALVWFMWERQSGDVYGKLVPREMKDEFAGVLPALMAVLRKDVPAPTLAELLEMLPEVIRVAKEDCQFVVTAYMRKRNPETKDHDWYAISIKDRNPATAALQVLMKLKGVAE